jgi:hypothetical protein
MDLKEIRNGSVDRIHPAQDRDKRQDNEPSVYSKLTLQEGSGST